MNNRQPLVAVAACIILSGCSNPIEQFSDARCDSSAARTVVADLIKKEIAASAFKQVQNESLGLSKGNIRAALNQIIFSIEDIRTTQKDPESTKRFCTGKLKSIFPVEIVNDAEAARSAADMQSISVLASDNDFEQSANSFTKDFDYSIQPTDDNEKIYAELDPEIISPRSFFSEFILSSLLRKKIERTRSERARQEAVEKAAQERLADESKQAALEEAQAENKLSVQHVAAVWQSLPNADRQRLLELQRAWIKKKSIGCTIEAAKSSVDQKEVETFRLKCDTSSNNDRASWLEQNFQSEI
jgi:uncharacterized protein YecT (DUF1311 family)